MYQAEVFRLGGGVFISPPRPEREQQESSSPPAGYDSTTSYWGLQFNDPRVEENFMAYMWCSRSKVAWSSLTMAFAFIIHPFNNANEFGTWSVTVYFLCAALLCGTFVMDAGLQLRDKSLQYPTSEFLGRCARQERMSVLVMTIVGIGFFITKYHTLRNCVRDFEPLRECYRNQDALYFAYVTLFRALVHRNALAIPLMVLVLLVSIAARFVSPPTMDSDREFWPKLFMMISYTVSCAILQILRERNSRRFFLLELSIRHSEQRAMYEKDRIRTIVATMLPREVLYRVGASRGSERKADVRECASILQFDVVNFTRWCSTRDSAVVVKTMSQLVTQFDAEVLLVGAQKLKMIGDAYQATTGLFGAHWNDGKSSAVGLFFLANRMHTVMRSSEFPEWTGRIGIATGQLMGTIVGSAPYRYDVFGDVAERVVQLEPNSAPEHTLLCPASELQVATVFPDLAGRSERVHDNDAIVGYMYKLCSDFCGTSDWATINPTSRSISGSDTMSSEFRQQLTISVQDEGAEKSIDAEGKGGSHIRTTPSLELAPTPSSQTSRQLAELTPKRAHGNSNSNTPVQFSLSQEESLPTFDHSTTGDSETLVPMISILQQRLMSEARHMKLEDQAVDGATGESDSDETSAESQNPLNISEDEALRFQLRAGHRMAAFAFYVCFVFYISCLVALGLEGVLLTHTFLAIAIIVCACLTAIPIIATHVHQELSPFGNAVYIVVTENIFHICCGLSKGTIVSNTLSYTTPLYGICCVYLLLGMPQTARQVVYCSLCLLQVVYQMLFYGFWTASLSTILIVGILVVATNHFMAQEYHFHCLQSKRAALSVAQAEAEAEALEGVLMGIMPRHVVPELLRRLHANSFAPIIQDLENVGIGFFRIQHRQHSLVNQPKAIGMDAIRGIRRILYVVERVMPEFNRLMVVKTIGNVLMIGSCLSAEQQQYHEEGLAQILEIPVRLEQELNLKKGKDRQQEAEPPRLVLHCGVHVGTATTTVMGINQLNYDVYGTTVNGASRVLSVGCSGVHSDQSTVAVSEVVARRSSGESSVWSDPFTITAKGLGNLSVQRAPIAALRQLKNCKK